MNVPLRQVRARHDAETITVYQAYGSHIGEPTAREGRFPDWYDRGRMTWIKPSFLWMMYRCGWATKPGQETVLALRLRRSGFEWALAHSALSHFDRRLHTDRAAWKDSLRRPVRVQWDPERDLRLAALPHRAIQVGLSGEAVRRYVDEWIVDITDVTPLAHRVHELVRAGDLTAAADLLPPEHPYELSTVLAEQVGCRLSDPPSAAS